MLVPIDAKCIQKIRGKNNIIKAYKLADEYGKIKIVNSDELKRAIRDNCIRVTNLKLTSDNRLIDTYGNGKKHISIDRDEYINNTIAMLKLCSRNFKEVELMCDGKCYLFEISDNNYVLAIPPGIKTLWQDIFDNPCRNIVCNLKVIGGDYLLDIDYMFYQCTLESLDLSEFNTQNVTSMKNAFYCCTLKRPLNLSNLNTSKVRDMYGMLSSFYAPRIILNGIDTRNVSNMCAMFHNCQTNSLEINKINTSNVADMQEMFEYAKIPNLDLSNFDTRHVLTMKRMFKGCTLKDINIKSFDTSRVMIINSMFNGCIAEEVDLRTIKTDSLRAAYGIFLDYKGVVKVSKEIIEEIEKLDTTFQSYECKIEIC